MTEREWSRLLDASPGDAELRRAYASWLQDERDDLAAAEFQRWLADEAKWPTPEPMNETEKGWFWYYSREPIVEPVKNATLAPWAIAHMPQGRWIYADRGEAEAALFAAWQSWLVAEPEASAPKSARRPRRRERLA